MEARSVIRGSKPASLAVGGVAAIGCSFGVLRMLRDRARKAVSSARHGFDDCLIRVGDGLAHLADAARQRLVGHDHVRPDRLDQLVLGDKAPGIFDQTAQHLEALGTQIDFAIGGPQTALRNIQRIFTELEYHERGSFLPLRIDPLFERYPCPVSSNFREIAWFFQDWRSNLPQKQPQVQSAN